MQPLWPPQCAPEVATKVIVVALVADQTGVPEILHSQMVELDFVYVTLVPAVEVEHFHSYSTVHLFLILLAQLVEA